MLGAITGDIVGSVYEFNNLRRKDFEPLFHQDSKFTDDTVCTVAIADALLQDKDPAQTLRDWCERYWSNGGWGKQFARWLAKGKNEPYNSFGNGSAMRVSAAAWLAKDYEHAMALAHKVTVITHNHPEGIKGAHATTAAIYWAIHGATPAHIRANVGSLFGYDLSRSVDDIRVNNPRSEACQHTVPEAITCAVEASSFEDALRNAVSIGGDSDTIAAITGSIAEALFGIPDEIRETASGYLPEDMLTVVSSFYASRSAG
jgi:ADP-ribosyl-[dinitrogen reductase] hydrolase